MLGIAALGFLTVDLGTPRGSDLRGIGMFMGGVGGIGGLVAGSVVGRRRPFERWDAVRLRPESR